MTLLVVFLRSYISVLALDINIEQGIHMDPLEFIDHYDLNYGNFLTGRDMSARDILLWREQSFLSLVCILRKYIGIGANDIARNVWKVSQTLCNFVFRSR